MHRIGHFGLTLCTLTLCTLDISLWIITLHFGLTTLHTLDWQSSIDTLHFGLTLSLLEKCFNTKDCWHFSFHFWRTASMVTHTAETHLHLQIWKQLCFSSVCVCVTIETHLQKWTEMCFMISSVCVTIETHLQIWKIDTFGYPVLDFHFWVSLSVDTLGGLTLLIEIQK